MMGKKKRRKIEPKEDKPKSREEKLEEERDHQILVLNSEKQRRWSHSQCSMGQCVVFSGKTLYPHSTPPHPGVYMGTGDLLGKSDDVLEGGGEKELCDSLAFHSGGRSNTPGNRDKVGSWADHWLENKLQLFSLHDRKEIIFYKLRGL